MNEHRWIFALSPTGAARSVGLHLIEAFRNRIGTERCKVFDTHTYYQAFTKLLKAPDETIAVDLLNQSFVVSALDFGATHLLVLALSPVTLFSLNLLRKQKVKAIHWFYEDFRRALYWKEVIRGYDHFFAIQYGPLRESCLQAGVNFHFLPTAAFTAQAGSTSGARTDDIAFVGIPSKYRISVLEHLAANGFHLRIAGEGWDQYRGSLQPMIVKGTWTAEKQAFELLQQSRIGLNLSVSEPLDREVTHVSPRVFDIAAAGCILVTEDIVLLRESFPECCACTFNSVPELTSLLKQLLSSPATTSSEEIRKNQNAVVHSHQYANRVESIISLTL